MVSLRFCLPLLGWSPHGCPWLEFAWCPLLLGWSSHVLSLAGVRMVVLLSLAGVRMVILLSLAGVRMVVLLSLARFALSQLYQLELQSHWECCDPLHLANWNCPYIVVYIVFLLPLLFTFADWESNRVPDRICYIQPKVKMLVLAFVFFLYYTTNSIAHSTALLVAIPDVFFRFFWVNQDVYQKIRR